MYPSSLDRLYLEWLYGLVEDGRDESYWDLMKVLFQIQFVYFIKYDQNRALDGSHLRREFLHDRYIDSDNVKDPQWQGMECSMLEMFIALARRLTFQVDITVPDAFWHILSNVGLESQDDHNIDAEFVQDVIYRISSRTYSASGAGGLFPLQHPHRDQRYFELLTQMYDYVNEGRRLGLL